MSPDSADEAIGADYFERTAAFLLGHPAGLPPESGIHCRLAAAIRARLGPADVCPLVRHVLLRAAHGRTDGPTLAVSPALATPDDWRWHGIEATAHGDHLILRAAPWTPEWLPGARIGVDSAAAALERRRELRPGPGDPFLRSLGREDYLSDGQRAAVRAVVTAPPGATLLVNLPTGSGKSLCGHILSQLSYPDAPLASLTVVVVPTTALCLDQERSLSRVVPIPTAYRSASDPAQQARNREIRHRIEDGEQPIVFTSPESLTGSLREALYRAASRGFLKALVIDEAHIVEAWGDDFRPAFQEIAGLRAALLRHAEGPLFRTVLLSATLTQGCVETLARLFGKPGPFKSISAVQVRPEPSYWIQECPDESACEERVLEAIRHLPRPLILYTTLVRDAERWGRRLRGLGYRRLDVMTGSTRGGERQKIVARWAAEQTDIVVATAAFGLGIDQAGVRAVVHATVPESLDRYYQEVGRGGRDGNACLSLMLYTYEDRKVAYDMGTSKIISLDRGRMRWQRMFETARRMGPSRFEVRLDTSPGLSEHDIDMQSVKNEAWNARTLTLLARAGVIELDDEPPPSTLLRHLSGDEALAGASSAHDAGDEVFRVPDDDALSRLTRVVMLREADHLSEEAWRRRVEPERAHTERDDQRQSALLNQVLAGHECVGEILARCYELDVRLDGAAPIMVSPAPSCGGCPACRRIGHAVYAHLPTRTRDVWSFAAPVSERLKHWAAGSRGFALRYPLHLDARARRDTFRWIAKWLPLNGVSGISAPSSVIADFATNVRELRRTVAFVHGWDPDAPQGASPPGAGLPDCDVAQFIEPQCGRVPQAEWDSLWRSNGRYLIVVMPEDVRDRARPDRLLRDILPCPCYNIDDFQRREGI